MFRKKSGSRLGLAKPRVDNQDIWCSAKHVVKRNTGSAQVVKQGVKNDDRFCSSGRRESAGKFARQHNRFWSLPVRWNIFPDDESITCRLSIVILFLWALDFERCRFTFGQIFSLAKSRLKYVNCGFHSHISSIYHLPSYF